MERGELSMQIALRIKARLRQLKLKRKEFAKIADVQESQVALWISGNHNYTIKTLERIQTILGISFFNFDNQDQQSVPCLPCEYSGLNQQQ